MVRLESYTLTTESVKRMKVRTHGKRTSKVKTQLAVLRRGEQVYSCGKPEFIESNKDKFNQFAKEFNPELGWKGTERTMPVRGQAVKYKIRTTLPVECLHNVNTLFREVLKFKRVTHADMLKAYMAFDEKRNKNLERIDKLLRVQNNTQERKVLLHKLKTKWKTCNAHCRYVVSTDVYFDFSGDNDAHDIKFRRLILGSIIVDKVFEDGGLFFNRKQCVIIQAWITANCIMM